MAIKVKHEGNVTSRAVAGAIGGQARRNAEDSKALSQRAAQENMAANRQLNGAHASPASPGHASAQLGHAPSLSAHAPTPTLATARMMNPILAERAETQQALADKSMEGRLRLQGEIADQRMREEYALRAQRGDIEALRKMQEWDRQHGILRQESEQDLLDKRAAANGYSPNAQREVDRLNKEYEDAVIDGRFSQEQLDDLKQQRDAAIAAIPKSRQKSPEEQFRESMVFGNRDNGLPEGAVFDPQTRKLVVDPNAQLELQARREERVQDRQDRLAAQEEQRYVNAYLALQRQGKTVDGMQEELTPDEIEAALKPLFPNRFTSANPNPYPVDPVTGFNSPEMEAARKQLAQPIAQPQPTANPTAQASTAANEPEWKKKLGW